jgi:DNA-binding MarR family transcriptional regulator
MQGTTAARDRLSDSELAAWRGFLRVHAAMAGELDAELEERHGLALSSYDVLVNLDGAPGRKMRMRDLAEAVLLSRSGITRLVDRLARDGLIERHACESDARGAYACLTDKGRSVLEKARPTHLDGVRRRFFGDLGPSDLAALASVWERVLPGSTARD